MRFNLIAYINCLWITQNEVKLLLGKSLATFFIDMQSFFFVERLYHAQFITILLVLLVILYFMVLTIISDVVVYLIFNKKILKTVLSCLQYSKGESVKYLNQSTIPTIVRFVFGFYVLWECSSIFVVIRFEVCYIIVQH